MIDFIFTSLAQDCRFDQSVKRMCPATLTE
jgi:hypothetical protein